MKRIFTPVFLLACVAGGWSAAPLGRAATADVPALKGNGGSAKDEIRIPAEYARAKLQTYSDPVPPAQYRAVVDVGPKRNSTRIATSSGNAAVDRVALDFADAYATQIKPLRELRRTRELRFPMVFDLREAVGVWHTPMPKRGLDISSRLHESGAVMIRVATGANGRVKDAQMVVKSRHWEMNKFMEDHARAHWTGPPNETTIIRRYVHTRWR